MGGNLNMSQEFINLKKMHKDTEDLNKVLTQLNLMERSTFKKITHFFFLTHENCIKCHVKYQKSILVLVTQSCPTLCDPIGYSPPGSSSHEILQASILEWVAFPFSKGSSQPGD